MRHGVRLLVRLYVEVNFFRALQIPASSRACVGADRAAANGALITIEA